MPDDQRNDDSVAGGGNQSPVTPGSASGPTGQGAGDADKRKPWPGNAAAAWRAKQQPQQRETIPAVFEGPASGVTGLRSQLELLLATQKGMSRRFFIRVGFFVALPCLIVLFYTALIATPRYVCNYQITYQSYTPSSTLSAGLTQSDVGSSMTSSIDYGTLLGQYISSAALAETIDKQLHLRDYYSSHHIDWYSRLTHNSNQTQFLKYWQSHVLVNEGFGGYITVEVQGFDPQFTLALAKAVDVEAGAMMNRLTLQARNSGIVSATTQLSLATVALQKSNDLLTDFRNKNGDLDPSLIATELAGVEGTLETQLAAAKAQLVQDQANMQPDASQIVQQQLLVSSIESQISVERQRLATSTGDTSYSNKVSHYETLLSNQLLATSVYQAAQQGLVIAQADAAQEQNYVVDYIPPFLPDQPTEPKPLESTAITFLACLCLWGIGTLLFSAFRDQSGF